VPLQPGHQVQRQADDGLDHRDGSAADVRLCQPVRVQAYKGGRREDRYHYFDRVTASLKVHSFDLAIEVFKLLALQYPVHIVDPNDPEKPS
jgi:hypothetical protein